ncbi:hypothetical protein BGX29_002820 [Mortierella sp. GBA35]|nr:hypothetical protein BGX29_002820 [Mortierella sp. GBA35]
MLTTGNDSLTSRTVARLSSTAIPAAHENEQEIVHNNKRARGVGNGDTEPLAVGSSDLAEEAHVDMDDASECFGKHLRQLRGLVLNNTFSTPEPWLLILLDKIRTMSEDEEAGVDARKVHLVATKYLGELAGQELDGVKVDPQATRTLEIVRLLASQCELDVESKPKPTEAMSVRIWQDVFEVLFKRTAISIVTGETGLAASKEERIQNESHHGGVETSLTPRKADFILKASVTKMGRTTHHDLVNFEHKSISASAVKVSVQLRKSQRHNHAVLVRLEALDDVVFLDIHGLQGKLMKMVREDGVHVCGQMCEAVFLPSNAYELEIFLRGRSLQALINLRTHVLNAAKKVREDLLVPRMPTTPPSRPSQPRTFYTPTSRNDVCLSQKRLSPSVGRQDG